MSGKCLINSLAASVPEAIHGLLLSRPDLAALSSLNVITVRNQNESAVAIISGGGAGHEPAHGGLVAHGMLTAAVSGNVFASPNVSQILGAIRTITYDAGALLVVKSYTGDRLAFGLAAETAKAEGLLVETVFVADDAAVDAGHIAGRRGIAGTVLVHKVAGALASAQAPLAVVAAAARHVAASVVSMGASLTTCSVPGAPVSTRLGQHQVELGLGIHGEPGHTILDCIPTADEVAEQLVAACIRRLAEVGALNGIVPERCPRLGLSAEMIVPDRLPVAVLVNDLGGLSNLELSILAGAVAKAIEVAPCTPRLSLSRLYAGPLMTSLDMKGVSLSILPLGWEEGSVYGRAWHTAIASSPDADAHAWKGMDVLSALDYPTSCHHWPVPVGITPGPPVAHYRQAKRMDAVAAPSAASAEPCIVLPRATVLLAASAASSALSACASEVTRLDSIAGDGDAGQTYEGMGKAVVQAMAALPDHADVRLDDVLRLAGAAVATHCGGTSGVLYALMLAAASTAAVRASQHLGGPLEQSLLQVCAACVRHAAVTASSYGGARIGDRTFLDVLFPLADALDAQSASKDVQGAPPLAEMVCTVVANAAAKTANMAPAAGRAAYVRAETVRGHPDAGAIATRDWIQALARLF